MSLSDDDRALVEEIRLRPQDTLPRLVYADYLEERGEPRGEFIRVQCELAELTVGDPSRAALLNREQELLRSHGESWLAPLRRLGARGVSVRCFQRGLIERVALRADALAQGAESLIEVEPALTAVEVSGASRDVAKLLELALPPQIEELDFSAGQLDADWVLQVSDAPWVSQVVTLGLEFNRLEDEGIDALVRRPWSRLRGLRLGSNRLTPPSMRRLGGWEALPRLESLDLQLNQVGEAGMRHLSDWHAPRLRRLNLSGCQLGTLAGLRAARLPALAHLELRNNAISSAEWRELRDSERGRNLRRLDTRNNPGAPPPDWDCSL